MRLWQQSGTRQPTQQTPLRPEFARSAIYVYVARQGFDWGPLRSITPAIAGSLSTPQGNQFSYSPPTNAGLLLTSDARGFWTDGGSVTLLTQAYRAGGASSGAFLGVDAASPAATSNNANVYLPYQIDGKVYWRWGAGEVEGTGSLSVASLSFAPTDWWAFTAGPRGMEIWQNGHLVGSNSASPTRTGTTGALLGAVASNAPGASNMFVGMLATFGEQLPQSVLSRPNYWGIFQGQRSRIWIPASAGGGTTISCSVGNATVGGTAATISTAQTIACGVGNAAAAGATASIALGSDITIDCAVGNAAAAGITAGISTAQAIVCAVGNVAAAGVTASIELGGVISIDCTVGNATASGVAATIDGANAAVVSAVSGGGGPVRRRRHSRLDTPTRDQLDELVQAQREAMGILPKPARNRIRAAVEKEAKRADPTLQSLAPTVASVAKAFDVPASNVADAARRAFEFRIAMQASQEALALIDQRDRDRRQEAARVEIEVRRRHQQKQEDARAHMARLVQDDETLIEQMNGLQREVVGVLLTLREQLRALIPTQA